MSHIPFKLASPVFPGGH